MAVTDISASRSIWSYAKVQRMVSRLIRNKPFLFRKDVGKSSMLNVGCGQYPAKGFVNLDWHWSPGVDVCWDLRKPYPFPADRFTGIYCEHCIDGLPHKWFVPNLRELYRVLKPGGTLRIIYCDSELYVDAYVKWRAERTPTPFMQDRGHRTGMQALDWVYHHATHQTLIDFETLDMHLRETGFSQVKRVGYREGRDAHLLLDREERRPESLYVEAVK